MMPGANKSLPGQDLRAMDVVFVLLNLLSNTIYG